MSLTDKIIPVNFFDNADRAVIKELARSAECSPNELVNCQAGVELLITTTTKRRPRQLALTEGARRLLEQKISPKRVEETSIFDGAVRVIYYGDQSALRIDRIIEMITVYPRPKK